MFLAAAALAALTISAFHGGPRHDGVFTTSAPAIARTLTGLQWRFPTSGEVIASPVTADGVVYAGSGDGRMYAIDLRSGAEVWRFDCGSPIHSTAALSDTLVVFQDRAGRITALDRRAGTKRWELRTGAALPLAWGYESGDHFVSSPVITGSTVVVGAADGRVYSLRLADGSLQWSTSLGEPLRSSVAVDREQVIAATMNGRIVSLSRRDGTQQWAFTTEGAGLDSSKFGFDRRSIQSSPALTDDTMYAGSRDGKLYALDRATGTLRWRNDHGTSWVITSVAVANGVVYAASSDAAFVQALDAKSGAELWRTPTGVPVWSSPALTPSAVIVADHAGRIRALDSANGRVLWTFRTAARVLSSPIVAGDLVVVGSSDGGIYALRIGDGAPLRAVHAPGSDLEKFLAHRDYRPLDDTALAAFLNERIDDRQPSVVAIKGDSAPPAIVTGGSSSLLRRYLDAGGKVVWSGIPPAMWPAGEAGKRSMLAIDYAATAAILAVDHSKSTFDDRRATATPAGLRSGLPERWLAEWSVPPNAVTLVLATDEWGLAASWLKSYGGPDGTGFVRAPDDLDSIYRLAEYRPRGAVNSARRGTPEPAAADRRDRTASGGCRTAARACAP